MVLIHSPFTIRYSQLVGSRSTSTCAAVWSPQEVVSVLPAPRYSPQGCRRAPLRPAQRPNRCSPSPGRPERLWGCAAHRKTMPLHANSKPMQPHSSMSHCHSSLRWRTGSHRRSWHTRPGPHRAVRQQGHGKCGAYIGPAPRNTRKRLAPIIARRRAAAVQCAIFLRVLPSFHCGSSAPVRPRCSQRQSPTWQALFPPQSVCRAL